jgi:hypothetical protein
VKPFLKLVECSFSSFCDVTSYLRLTGSKRKVTVSAFKGQTLINIREFYNDKTTGEEKPGNKGIALTLDQWKLLISQVSTNYCLFVCFC